jgi:tetratricopeptide (TPR) repeat protein
LTRRPAPVALALLALAVGCASVGFRCPVRGGPPWRDVASPNFVLRTDLDLAESRALLLRLERLRTAVISVLFEEAPTAPGGVEVVAFRSDAEYRPFAARDVAAYYLRSTGGPPRIVLSGQLRTGQRGMLGHELAHHFLAGTFLRQPRWFAEGMAAQLESLEDDDAAGLVVVGLPPLGRLTRVRQSSVPTRELLAWDGGPTLRPALDYYASAWLLVHYLAYRHPVPFGDLQRRLARGEEPDQAWSAAFPAWRLEDHRALAGLDQDLLTYSRAEIQSRFREVRQPWQDEPLVRAIPTAEVHAIRLTLWTQGPAKPIEALRAEVDEALAEEPDHPLALQQWAALVRADPVPLARRAVVSHADDPRAWTFLATALQGPDTAAEREGAYRRAAELAPGNAAALLNLAVELLAQGRSGEALPVARQAVVQAPWSPPVLDGYAAVLADLGRCAEAIPVQQRALEVLPERSSDAARRELLDRLARYRDQCRQQPGKAGPPTQAPPSGSAPAAR